MAAETIHTYFNKHFLFLLATDKETGVKFWSYSQNKKRKCWSWTGGQMDVVGGVPKGVDLLNDKIAHSLIIKGAQFMSDKCNAKRNVKVILVPQQGYKAELSSGRYVNLGPVKVKGFVSLPKVTSYNNYVLRANKKKIERKARKAKEEKEYKEAYRLYTEFVKKNGVEDWPSMEALSANPFVYEGKTIAIILSFETMLSATKGVFSGDDPIIVSNIPKGLFKSKTKVILAGHVLGKTEYKMPLIGEQMVPHLKFVGVHFCKDRRCKDIIRGLPKQKF